MRAATTLLMLLATSGALLSAQPIAPHVVHVGAVELHWIEMGAGAPVILLHGGQGDYRSWAPQMAALAPRYRVIAYSQRYHFPNRNGLTSRAHSAAVEADDLAAFIDALHLGRVHLVGTSMGAATALHFALAHPDAVRSLVLAEPPLHAWIRDSLPLASVYDDFMRSVQEPAAVAFRAGRDTAAMRAFVDGFAGAPRFDGLPPNVREGIMQNALAMKAIALSVDPYPVVDKAAVRRLRMPILIVTGANTVPIHRLVDAILGGLLPQAESVTIPAAGHGAARENPDAFNAAMLAFLAAVKIGRR